MSRPRARWDEVLLRVLPWPSPVRRMWAGTKLCAVLAVTICWLASPGWGAAAAAVLLVGAAAVTARVPASVVPRLPWWVLALLAIGAVTATIGGQPAAYLQATMIGFAVVALGAIVGWTTPLVEVAAALRTLGAPLRKVGLPVGQWAAACAVGVRSLPMLLDEWRVLLAVHRLRAAAAGSRPLRARLLAAADLLNRAHSAALRRAAEVGPAVAARGGPPDPAREAVHLGAPDAAALAAVVLAVVPAFLLPA